MMNMTEEELIKAVNDLGNGTHKIQEIECQVEKNRHNDMRTDAKQRKRKNAKTKSTTT